MQEYNFREIEQKWQKKWVDEKSFKAIDFHPTKPKYYVLYEFFNVSGNLHMGHLKGSVPADALARMKRFQGYNVLFPIGGDAFGLPAENAAIKTGINPKDFVANGFKNIVNQSQRLGLSFDWDRTFCTSDEDYYKWTQWIFLNLYNHGKAYKEIGKVNYCPNCKTTLSNEDSQGGVCDRCGGQVVQKERSVWWLKMKEYSEKLLGNVNRIQMNENLKEQQRNWIGKSTGVEVDVEIVGGGKFSIFTTCIETIYGITFFVIAPDGKLIKELLPRVKNRSEVETYIKETAKKTALDRTMNKSKSGCRLEGLMAINPVNGKQVPIFIGDFVLGDYGTGAVMAVPTHDQRDFEYAKAHNLEMIQVIDGADVTEKAFEKQDYLGKGCKLINSEEFTGLTVEQAKEAITAKLEKQNVARRVVNYKMTDWSFNRQRYWGEPFPIVNCPKDGLVALTEKDLPLLLPKTNDYLPNESGDSPLSKVESWVNCTCPKCGGMAKRETDTMPNWAGSSWYWLRYCDPHNNNALADFEKLKYWGSVDCYTGGTEHITRHVLYAFFWQNFLYEIGAVPTRDPFIRKMGSGLVLDDQGKKMSKSSANGVSPMEVVDKYGTDVARLHLHFLGGYEDSTPWTYDGINGITSFINRVWSLQDIIKGEGVSKEHIVDLNKTIKKVTEDLENLRLNTVISTLMIFLKRVKDDDFITKEELRQFLLLLNPLAPHITSEMYERVFDSQILDAEWPKYDEKFLVEDTVEIPIQVNGKLRGKITVNKDANEDEIKQKALKEVSTYVANGYKKIIYIPGRIFNIVV